MTAIRRRLVLLFPGFEPLSLSVHAERFRRGAHMAARAWNLGIEEDARPASDRDLAFELSGREWSTRTEVRICDWSETIALYGRRSPAQRIGNGFVALADFAISGTAFRYFATSWRYGLFFLYPIVLCLATLGATMLIAALPALMGLRAVHALWSVPLAAIFFAFALRRAIKRHHFLTLMDDWAFARALSRRSDPAVEARLSSLASSVAAGLERDGFDEIVVAGHSLGVSLAVHSLAEALKRAAPRAPLGLLSVGASLLKTALHPAAKSQREAVRAIVENHRALWVEVQSVSDPMNFYRSNPARSLGIEGGRTPIVQRISLGSLFSGRSQRRDRHDLFRRHRQFVYGSKKRHAYSFHMLLLGPVSFERYAEHLSVDVAPLAGPAPDQRSASE